MQLSKEQIVSTILEEEVKSSYLDYAMSVIVSRALPDVRDGLKPVHRRILYGMNELGMLPNRPYKKSARIVGDVLGKYHPHGDVAVYDAMVRMAQEWSMRYPLVDGQGNFGSMDGDPPAAMRYTEARLSWIATEMLKDIDKDTVDFVPNFDDTLKEPIVLPTVLPTLLINGASGIAVGMATNIPPHNLNNICDGLKALIQNPEIDDESLIKIVYAPDFPTGGIIYGYEGVKECYLTGRGRIILRARASIEESKSGKSSIIISELPYQVNKANLIEKIADLVRNKTIEQINNIRDESDRDGIRIVIELKKESIPKVVLNNLYKLTQLQVTFGAIMLALVNNQPKVLNLREMMLHFINHRNEVIVRRTKFDLNAAEKKAHILEGYLIALRNLDEVIKTIKESADPKTASENLQSKFQLTETQAKAILDLRLHRLTSLERDKILEDYNETIKLIKRLKAILDSKALQMQLIVDELTELQKKYGDERRTEVIFDSKDFTVEDTIADEDVIVTITHQGFIKRTPLNLFRKQKKGGQGVSGIGTREDDFVEHLFRATNHHFLLFFTDKGKCYKVKVYDIPEGNRTAKGRSIANIIEKDSDEKITAYLAVREFNDENYIVMATEKGIVKKTELSNFSNVRSSGIIAITLNENDKLISARLTDGSCDIILATYEGLACRFRETDIRPMGRVATGVRGITLDENDKVVSMIVIKRPDSQVLVVGENGYGKRTRYEDFRLTRRGAKGVISMNVTQKTGKVIGMLSVTDSEDLVAITKKGKTIRQAIKEIRLIGRKTQGVKLIHLEEGDLIADITVVPHDEDTQTNNINESENNSQIDNLFNDNNYNNNFDIDSPDFQDEQIN